MSMATPGNSESAQSATFTEKVDLGLQTGSIIGHYYDNGQFLEEYISPFPAGSAGCADGLGTRAPAPRIGAAPPLDFIAQEWSSPEISDESSPEALDESGLEASDESSLEASNVSNLGPFNSNTSEASSGSNFEASTDSDVHGESSNGGSKDVSECIVVFATESLLFPDNSTAESRDAQALGDLFLEALPVGLEDGESDDLLLAPLSSSTLQR